MPLAPLSPAARPSRRRTPWLLLALTLGALLGAAPAGAGAEDGPAADEAARARALIEAFRGDSPEARVEAVQAAGTLQHKSLTSPLIRLLGDEHRGVREAAIEALALRTDPSARRKASSSLAARLPRLDRDGADRDELLLVIAALGRLEQPGAVKPLLDGIRLDSDLDVVKARLAAVSEIPDKKAIEGLIDFLARGRRGGAQAQRDAARKALQHATGTTLGEEQRGAGRDADRWRAWWREHERGFDFAAVKEARKQAATEAAEKAERRAERRERREGKERERRGKGRDGKDAPEEGDGSDA